MQPPLPFSAVPDAVLGAEHPSPAFAVEHSEVANREPERARLQTAIAAFLDQEPVARFGVGKRIDGHAQSMPPHSWGGRLSLRSSDSRVGRNRDLNRAGVESAEPGSPG